MSLFNFQIGNVMLFLKVFHYFRISIAHMLSIVVHLSFFVHVPYLLLDSEDKLVQIGDKVKQYFLFRGICAQELMEVDFEFD